MAEGASAAGARATMDPRPVAGAAGLVERFLANRVGRTLQAYTVYIEDFARFAGRAAPADAIEDLLGGGPGAARLLVMDYAVHLLARGRARSTVGRRLATMRALARMAREVGVVEWVLEVPSEEEISRAVEERSDGASHYLFPRHPGEIDRLDVQPSALREALGAN